MENQNYSQMPPPPSNPQMGHQPPQMIQQYPQMNAGYIPPNTTGQIAMPQNQPVPSCLPRNANNSPSPTPIQCPACNKIGVTNVRAQTGGGTWTCAVILFFVTAGFCCCIPFFNQSCQDKMHNCSHCGALVGHHEYRVL